MGRIREAKGELKKHLITSHKLGLNPFYAYLFFSALILLTRSFYFPRTLVVLEIRRVLQRLTQTGPWIYVSITKKPF